jgi:hypothetical protein
MAGGVAVGSFGLHIVPLKMRYSLNCGQVSLTNSRDCDATIIRLAVKDIALLCNQFSNTSSVFGCSSAQGRIRLQNRLMLSLTFLGYKFFEKNDSMIALLDQLSMLCIMN